MFNNRNLDIKRGIVLPKENSEKLAEFIGILAGDGYINFKKDHDYTIAIAGHKIDDEVYHINYVYPLFKDLFGFEPKILIKNGQRTRYIRVRAKTLVEFFEKQGFYKFKGKISIPKWIFNNEIYLNKFLRGLVDTDGSIAIKKRYTKIPYYPVLSISNKNYNLMEEISKYLREKGFTLWFGLSKNYDKRSKTYSLVYKIELSGLKNLKAWNDLISFSNYKNIKKLEKLKIIKMGREGFS